MGWQVLVVIIGFCGVVFIVDMDVMVFEEVLVVGEVFVLVGYQGIICEVELCMLGCGGIDFLAVVLVVVLYVCCDIYIDVDGVYMIDFCIELGVICLDVVSYDEMLELVSQGVKVLQLCFVEYVKVQGVQMKVVFSFVEFGESWGMYVVFECVLGECCFVSGVVYVCDQVCIVLFGVSVFSQLVEIVFEVLVEVGIGVDMIVQVYGCDDGCYNLEFLVVQCDLKNVLYVVEGVVDGFVFFYEIGLVKVFVVGVGLCQ